MTQYILGNNVTFHSQQLQLASVVDSSQYDIDSLRRAGAVLVRLPNPTVEARAEKIRSLQRDGRSDAVKEASFKAAVVDSIETVNAPLDGQVLSWNATLLAYEWVTAATLPIPAGGIETINVPSGGQVISWNAGVLGYEWVSVATLPIAAANVSLDTTNFDKALTAADNTAQKVADTLDDQPGVLALTTAQRIALPSPFVGRPVYDTDLKRLYIWDSSWVEV
jgi:hypothetical protein